MSEPQTFLDMRLAPLDARRRREYIARFGPRLASLALSLRMTTMLVAATGEGRGLSKDEIREKVHAALKLAFEDDHEWAKDEQYVSMVRVAVEEAIADVLEADDE